MEFIVRRLRLLVLTLCCVLGLGMLGFAKLEGMSFADGLYLSVVTVATVGYGDLHPVTGPGKLLAVLLIVTGVGTFLGVVANGTELLMERRQEAARRERLQMLISLFFSEIGKKLLTIIARADSERDKCTEVFALAQDWKTTDFARALKGSSELKFEVVPERLALLELKQHMDRSGTLLINLLSNSALHEHERFTELLVAIFHLRDELINRTDLEHSPTPDLVHLAGDANRIYKPLTLHWLEHKRHLKGSYPFLYSLAVRMNPFGGCEEDCAVLK